MSKRRATFENPDVVKALVAVLSDHVTPAGGKVDWKIVAATMQTRTGIHYDAGSIKNWYTNKKTKYHAWKTIKQWTGLGWKADGCPDVDTKGEKWLDFLDVFIHFPLIQCFVIYISKLFLLGWY